MAADFPEHQKDKQTISSLAKSLSQLTAEKKRAALETSAAIAGVSLRGSREFVEAVPKAAEILSADDLKLWGELGRRLAMGNADLGTQFFADGVEALRKVPTASRGLVFSICTKQLVLSSSIATDTFRSMQNLVDEIGDDVLLSSVLELAYLVAQRSAKHSADLLSASPAMAKALQRFGDRRAEVTASAVRLAGVFATRTGGMTADLWAGAPASLDKIDAASAVILLDDAERCLELGGSVTLHFISSGADVLAASPKLFDKWRDLSRAIAVHGNAVLIAFLRATPKFFFNLGRRHGVDIEAVKRVLELTGRIAADDAESALAAFRSSTAALSKVSIEQYEEWVLGGISEYRDKSSKARRSYFALETRESNERLTKRKTGISLESVQNILHTYIEGLTGNAVEIAPLSAMPQETRIGDGKTIYLPASVEEFSDDDKDFRLFKVLAAHGAGQIEFGTFAKDTAELAAMYRELSSLYEATADQIDAFSLAGYIEDVRKGERARPDDAPAKKAAKLPRGSDYHVVLNAFPEPRLARKIFGTMENARIDAMLRRSYRGLRGDLDLMRGLLKQKRPYIFDLPMYQVPFELLFQITMCGGATDDARQFYGQIVSEVETVVENYLQSDRQLETSTVADSLMATSRVYNLFQNIKPEQAQEAEAEQDEQKGEFAYEDNESAESVTEDKVKRERPAQDVSELFNAWNSLDDEGEPDDLQGAEAWTSGDIPEQPLETDDVAFAYDEWDRDLNDYRVGWSRVIEKRVKEGDRTFVELTRSRYRGVISSIRHQFQLMKPENLTRIHRELDGEDYDLNALVDLVIDRRADGRQSENIYTKRLRRQRDVAVSLLLDQSSSTARTITRNPLQPYTHPGRRIIEIEKEGLVLMSEALEAVGDIYSINGFTSEGRRNVKFYVVKDFNEKYSDEVEKRIGGITFQNNTRLGAAIRHAAAKLLKQESRTKLLIVLTDGRPYDHDYGDARYAREDVREALIEAKTSGIIPFCITIDRESEAELKDLYGSVGYTIIDDVLSLPERMPNIYKRLTS